MPIAARRAYVACGDTRGAPWVSYEGIRWFTWGTCEGTRSWCRGGWYMGRVGVVFSFAITESIIVLIAASSVLY
jgi:hypothetical protein